MGEPNSHTTRGYVHESDRLISDSIEILAQVAAVSTALESFA